MLDEGPSIITEQWVLFGVACLAIIIRIGACRRHEYGFWWDDFVMFAAMAVFLATCITGTIALRWGIGRFPQDVAPSMLPKATKMGIIAVDLGMVADVVPKLAVALLIFRLFRPQVWLKWLMIALVLLCLIFNVILIILSFVQCHPEKYQWNRTTMTGSCWSIHVYTDFAYFTGAWTSMLDLLFGLYPLLVISQLRMQWQKKLGVMATMSLGLATFAITSYKVITQFPLFLQGASDAPRVLANIMFWQAMGIGFTIIAGSVPTFGWLFCTNTWRRFVFWISRGRIRSSKRASELHEKLNFATVSTRTTPHASVQVTPQSSQPPSRDQIPIAFPDTLHLSNNNTVHSERRPSTKRNHPVPLDSLQRLERDTWG